MSAQPNARKNFYLFGYPIAHSASPALHNTIFESLGLPNRYTLHDAEVADQAEMLDLIRSDEFGGSAVTMPLKVTIMPYLDRLEPEAKEIGSVNTIIVKRNPETGKNEVVGQNFDWMGVRNSLVSSLPKEKQSHPHPFGEGKCAFNIGGGGTTRAAVFALSNLGLSPIFLINRDAGETAEIIAQFPQYDLRPLKGPAEWTEEWQDKVVVGVGAIPSFAPVTDAEKNVYACAHEIFDGRNVDGRSRHLLEMCYKPRRTPILIAAEEKGWVTVQGVEAMIEQGVAQNNAWLYKSEAARFDASGSVPEEVVEKVRVLIRSMDDIKPSL